MKLICIKCPKGCEITVDGDNITGNTCPRGKEYAIEEMTCPMRIVTALAKSNKGIVPVKTDKEVKKSDIDKVLKEISKLRIINPRIGQIVINNVIGSESNIVVTGKPYRVE